MDQPASPDPELDLEAINRRHIHGIDKWYRMFAGSASELLSFEGGVLEIEVRVDRRLKKFTPAEMARKLAHSWRRQPELQGATEFAAHVYRTHRPVGFVIPAKGRSRDELAGELASRCEELAEEHPDVMWETVRGRFTDDPDPER